MAMFVGFERRCRRNYAPFSPSRRFASSQLRRNRFVQAQVYGRRRCEDLGYVWGKVEVLGCYNSTSFAICNINKQRNTHTVHLYLIPVAYFLSIISHVEPYVAVLGKR